MRILAISSASRGCWMGLIEAGMAPALVRLEAERGLAALIPPALAALLGRHGDDSPRLPGLVAVVVGPGSFTGLRGGIAVALGVGLGAGVPVVGVTVAEALAASLPFLGDRLLWVAMAARPGRIFLDRSGDRTEDRRDEPGAFAHDDLPRPSAPIAMAGDAANAAAAVLAARGADVMLTSARVPSPASVAEIGLRRWRGDLPALTALPLYVDAPEAKLPAAGLRPAPQ